MIETIVSMPAVSLSLFVVGVVCGAVVASVVLPSRREVDRLTGELTALKSEHESYKGHVSEHFLKTSELVANMTASYKAVYDHLATGAQSLCSDTDALEAPKFGSPKLIFDPTIEVAQKPAPTPQPDVAESRPAAETPPEAPAAPQPVTEATPASAAAEPASEVASEEPRKDSEWRMESTDSSAGEDPGDAVPDPSTTDRERTGETA
jgi:uncharacterized membrane-anchored protein YhcB (DUF1043 family)